MGVSLRRKETTVLDEDCLTRTARLAIHLDPQGIKRVTEKAARKVFEC
jgi:hypothetical protein